MRISHALFNNCGCLHPPQNLRTRRHRHLSQTSAQRRPIVRDAGLPHQPVRLAAHSGRAGCRCFCQCAHMPLPNAHIPLFCATVFRYSRLAHSVCTRDIYGSARYGNTSALRAHRTYTDPFVRERRCPRSIARECTNAESGCPNAPTPRRQVSGARATKSHAR